MTAGYSRQLTKVGAVFSDNYESLNQFCLIVLNSLAWHFATGRGFYLTPAERSG